MKVILKSTRIIDVNSKHHNKVKDILIEDGIITKIENKISKKGVRFIGAIGLGQLLITVFNLVPKPPARIITFILFPI